MKQELDFEEEVIDTVSEEIIEPSILSAKLSLNNKGAEIIVSCIFLTIAITLLCFGLCNFITLAILVMGALWNFFTDSNQFFACIFAFLVCIPFAIYSSNLGVYGFAMLHIAFYIPTQLIYYYDNKNKKDIGIMEIKSLEAGGIVGTTLVSLILSVGLSLMLYNLGEEFFYLDAISTVLLMVSVFLVNGRYKEYWPVRLIATMVASLSWLFFAVFYDFKEGSVIFSLMFLMYFTMDCIRYFKWATKVKEENKKLEKVDAEK